MKDEQHNRAPAIRRPPQFREGRALCLGGAVHPVGSAARLPCRLFWTYLHSRATGHSQLAAWLLPLAIWSLRRGLRVRLQLRENLLGFGVAGAAFPPTPPGGRTAAGETSGGPGRGDDGY